MASGSSFVRPGGVGAGSHKKKNGKGLWIMTFDMVYIDKEK